jgi:hypothetical protein
MARSFSADFTTRMMEAHQRPYLVLKVYWNGGEKYYIDRETGTFSAAGDRHPAEVEDGLVVDWGVPSQTLREMQIGSVDSLTLKLFDHEGELSTILGTNPQQRRAVEIYRMFDEDDVTWPTDAALVFAGVTKPFSYSESDNVVTFEVEDPSRMLLGTVGRLAKRVIFPNVAPEHEDKCVPNVWGRAERVEGVLVKKPWQVRITEPLNLGSGLGSRVPLDEHPDELGITPDVEIDCILGPADDPGGVMGLTGRFRQSVNKAQKPSYFEVTGLAGYSYDTFAIVSVYNPGTPYAAALIHTTGGNVGRVTGDANCSVQTDSGTFFGKIIGYHPDSPDTGRRLVTFNNPLMCEALAAHQVLRLWYRNVHVVLDSEDPETVPRSALGTIGEIDGGTGQVQRVFYFTQPTNIIGDVVEMFPAPFNARPLGSADNFPVTAMEADTPTPGSYRMTVEYNRAALPGLDAYGAGDELDLGYQAVLAVELAAGNYLRPVDGDWVYAVNAFPSVEIERVEGYGDGPDQSQAGRKDFQILPAKYPITLAGDNDDLGEALRFATAWTADLTNDEWNLTGGEDGTEADFGTDVTTITFPKAPRQIFPSLDSDRIWVTLRGIDYNFNGSSTVIYNPADVLLAYLENEYLLGVPSDYRDDASFETLAASQELVDRKVGFAQIEAKDGLTLLQDIARQCRSNIIFDQGKFSLRLLRNVSRAWDATFRQTSILESTLVRKETPVDEMPTRITAKWRYKWDDKQQPRQRLAVNLGAEDVYKINNRALEIWLYGEPESVDAEIAFWLERWSRIYWEVTFSTFGRALVLQPGDWIDLGYTDGTGREIVPAGTRCEVTAIKDKAPSGLVEVTCRYPKFEF